MKRILLFLGVTASIASPLAHGHGDMQGQEPKRASSVERRETRPMEQARSFSGKVRAIDKDSGKVTLKHEAMSVLDVPAATAAYAVKDASLLDRVKVGDPVRFTAVLQGRAIVVTSIERRD